MCGKCTALASVLYAGLNDKSETKGIGNDGQLRFGQHACMTSMNNTDEQLGPEASEARLVINKLNPS